MQRRGIFKLKALFSAGLIPKILPLILPSGAARDQIAQFSEENRFKKEE